jgi:PAS domain S-box-containing protein
MKKPTKPRLSDKSTLEAMEDFFENGSIPLHWVGADGTILRANAAELRLLGYERDEYVGRHIADFHVDRHVIEDILARLGRHETIRDYEARLRCKDGSLKHVLIDSSVFRRNGRFVHTRCFTRDITQRRFDEQHLSATMQRLEALYHLADRVGRAKDVVSVCEAAIEAIMAVGASRASVLLFDDGGVMRFRAWRNLSEGYRSAVDGHSPWSRDTSSPTPIVIEDVLQDPGIGALRDVIAAEGIRALAFVPLASHGQLLGKFMVYYDAVHSFSAPEMRLAGSIAQHVAFGLARVLSDVAIEDLLTREQAARREADAARVESEERRLLAEELARLARAMNETLDVASVADRIGGAALTLFRARASSLRLAAPDGSLVGVAFAGGMKDAFAVGHTIPAGPASVSGLAVMQGSPVWTDDCFSDARLIMAEEIGHGMRRAGDAAVLAAPLLNKGRALGALSIADRLGRRFSNADAEMLQAFADQAALALENARLYEDARRRQREAEVVAELTQRMNASLDLQTTLLGLVEGARELCEGDIARIVVRDAASGEMRLRHQVGTRWPGYHEGMVIEPGKGTGGIVLAAQQPFRTDDYAADPRISPDYVAASLADGTVAQIVVPIPGDSGIAGLLYVDRRTRRPFTDAEEAILVRLADHAGTAIRNSQLFAAEQVARAEADAANRAKDQFLAMLSHELRTPLTAITGWARLLTAGRLDAAQQRHAAGVIQRNAQLQAELVSDLLDISRVVAGKMELERSRVDLLLVVRAAVEAAGAELEAKGLRLSTELHPAAGEILGEPRRLQQIVSNLISNAVKFTPAGGLVEVRLGRHETSARLVVTDTGEGIDPALLPRRIFDPFEQGDSSTTRKHQGLGLGLAIVRQLVELHGGTVHAESRGKGEGATFTVDLPVLAVRGGRGTADDRAGEAALPASGLEGCRVLIVDDQSDARELLGIVIAQTGAKVQVTASASEALRELATQDIDMLVSDIAMPAMDGFTLIETIRARERERGGRAIKAVAVTAHMGREVRERALAAGFDAHAVKPLDPENLVALLARLRRNGSEPV